MSLSCGRRRKYKDVDALEETHEATYEEPSEP
jgi:hypothetical protein